MIVESSGTISEFKYDFAKNTGFVSQPGSNQTWPITALFLQSKNLFQVSNRKFSRASLIYQPIHQSYTFEFLSQKGVETAAVTMLSFNTVRMPAPKLVNGYPYPSQEMAFAFTDHNGQRIQAQYTFAPASGTMTAVTTGQTWDIFGIMQPRPGQHLYDLFHNHPEYDQAHLMYDDHRLMYVLRYYTKSNRFVTVDVDVSVFNCALMLAPKVLAARTTALVSTSAPGPVSTSPKIASPTGSAPTVAPTRNEELERFRQRKDDIWKFIQESAGKSGG